MKILQALLKILKTRKENWTIERRMRDELAFIRSQCKKREPLT